MKFKIAHTSILAVAVATLFAASCDKIKDLIKINVPLETANVTFDLPAIPTTGTFTSDAVNVAVNIDSLIKANNAEGAAKNIRSVKLTSLVFVISNGDSLNNNFSALESCKAEFATNTKTEWQALGEVTNNPNTVAFTLTIPANNSVDLKEYFQASQFSYRISGTTRKPITKPLSIKATIKYDMEVGL